MRTFLKKICKMNCNLVSLAVYWNFITVFVSQYQINLSLPKLTWPSKHDLSQLNVLTKYTTPAGCLCGVSNPSTGPSCQISFLQSYQIFQNTNFRTGKTSWRFFVRFGTGARSTTSCSSWTPSSTGSTSTRTWRNKSQKSIQSGHERSQTFIRGGGAKTYYFGRPGDGKDPLLPFPGCHLSIAWHSGREGVFLQGVTWAIMVFNTLFFNYFGI